MKLPLYLDLETVVDPAIPEDKPRVIKYQREEIRYAGEAEAIQETHPVDFPTLSRWRIVSCGTLTFARGFQALGQYGDCYDERIPVEDVASLLSEHTLVTWNGRGFDVPLLCLRALALGVPLPQWFGQYRARYRYADNAHLDVKDFVSDYGAAKCGSLDQVARLVGLPGKLGTDGTSVAGLAAEGRWAEIHAYCLTDVAQTALLERRVAYLRGMLTLEHAREDLMHILAKVDEEPRLAALAGAIDRPKLLMLPCENRPAGAM